jgi:C-terminal processing protease CtpA/Prc
MLRMLLLYSLIAPVQAPPGDGEPKPSNVEVEPRLEVKVNPEDGGKSEPDRRFTYFAQQGFDPLWRGNGQEFRLDINQGSDLTLVAVDDALRAQLKLPKDRGLVASSVRAQGSAWEAGVQENDILLTLDDAPLARPEDLDAKLKEADGKTATLTLMRKGKTMTLSVRPKVSVTLGPAPQEKSEYWIGVALAPVAPVLRDQLHLQDYAMKIAQVYPDGPAARNGVKADDILLTVGTDGPDGVSSVHLARDASMLHGLAQKIGGRELRLNLLRDGDHITIKLTPEKHLTARPAARAWNRAATVVRPGVVQDYVNTGTTGWVTLPDANAHLSPAADSSSKRLDAMADEIKELRKAIDGLRKALEDRK